MSNLIDKFSKVSPDFTIPTANIRPGYKWTEVGLIPEEWSIISIGNFAPLQRGFDLPKSQLHEGIYPVVYSNGILYFHSRAMKKAPGIVTGRSGTIGKVHFITDDYWPHNTTLWVTSFCGNDPKFIFYLFQYIDFSRFLSGSGVPTLNRNDVHQFRVAYPPLPEQRAIAEALSDMDGLLVTLDRLIEKKRAIKQATMQQLLSGKTRLPEFEAKRNCKKTEGGLIPEDWELQKLGKLVNITTGRKDVNEGNPDGMYPFFTCSRKNTFSDAYSFEEEAILIAGNGDVGTMHYFHGKFEAYQRTYVLYKIQGNVRFIWYQLELRLIESLLLKKIGSSIPYIKIEDLTEFIIPFPKDEREQNAIAAFLSDIDTEIEMLGKRREKIKQIKKGMILELLTGRIRLVKPKGTGVSE